MSLTIPEMEKLQSMIERSVKHAVEASVPESVRKTVNGKIDDFRKENKQLADDINKKVDDHMIELRPYMQAAAGAKFGFKFFVWIGSVATAYAALKAIFPKWLP